jgi:segregation and condensation protein B
MELKLILEAILFSAQKPLSLKELRDVFAVAPDHAEGDELVRGLKKVKEEELTAALEQLAQDHEAAQRTYRLVCVAGSWQFVTEPGYAPWLKALVGHRARPPRLSAPGLETLAIIAYRQPVTRAEIEQVRGVAVDGVMQTLLERGLVAQAGRAEVIGRPMTYATTPLFLEYFGLRALEDLPAADELRRIVVEKPEALATVEPDLATAPEEAAPQVEATVESLTSEGGEQSPAESPNSEAQTAEPAAEEAKAESPAPEATAESPQAEASAPKKSRRSRSKAKQPEETPSPASEAPAEAASPESAPEVKEPDETSGTSQGD